MIRSDKSAKPRMFPVEDVTAVVFGLLVGDLSGVVDLVSFMTADDGVTEANVASKMQECQIALKCQFSWNPIADAGDEVKVFPLARVVKGQE